MQDRISRPPDQRSKSTFSKRASAFTSTTATTQTERMKRQNQNRQNYVAHLPLRFKPFKGSREFALSNLLVCICFYLASVGRYKKLGLAPPYLLTLRWSIALQCQFQRNLMHWRPCGLPLACLSGAGQAILARVQTLGTLGNFPE